MLDPRLADRTLLGLAALRLQQRQAQSPPGRKVTLEVVYADEPGEPPMPGYQVVYYLRDDGSAWRADDAT
jgi:hypothetical protein